MLLRKSATALAVAGIMSIAAVPAKAVDLTVTHWGVLVYGAPFAVAKEKGFFAEQGIDVDNFITSKGGGTTVRNALASEVPYAEAALTAVISAIQEGLPLTIVHAGIRTVADQIWVTRPDATDINTIEDLRGKRVGYTSPRSLSQSVLQMSMDAAGIGPGEFEPVSLGGLGAGLTQLEQGNVEAALIVEPVLTRMGDKFKPVFYPAELVPPLAVTVGMVRTDYLKENPDLIRGIIAARRKGVEYILKNPAESGRILAKMTDQDPEILAKVIEKVVVMDYWSLGNFEMDAMKNMVDGLRLVGAIGDEELDWPNIIDESLLPEDLQGGAAW